jgi:hypothetical protein
MNAIKNIVLVSSMLLAAAAASANAAVMVRYQNPEQFADIGPQHDRDDALREIERHFGKMAKHLQPGQDLNVEVLDIDLAGRLEPFRYATPDLRVLRGTADWPTMQVRYTLTEQGRVLRSGEARLANQAYLHRIETYANGDPLRYEKQMIDDWFRHEFKVRRR